MTNYGLSRTTSERMFLRLLEWWTSRRNLVIHLDEFVGSPLLEVFPFSERTPVQTMLEVKQKAARLQELIHFHPRYLEAVGTYPNVPGFSANLDNMIRAWIASRGSQFMWAEGRATTFEQSMTLPKVGMRLCGYAHRVGIPVAIYSPHGHRNIETKSPDAGHTPSIIDLLYTLIRQLVIYLPEEFERSGTFHESNFRKLNGKPSSIVSAIDMLVSLFVFLPYDLVCVIDGIDKLESSESMPHLRDLLQVLKKECEQRKIKILFTTSGPSRLLPEFVPDAQHTTNVFR
ncbi:hypothetical protein F5Y02DRAFT_430613 [Annulohypoxylon stygium]|nr:hypothetical protein F5Y02DRAFT_430613 [Annulohypoxylon stygium]